MCNRHMKAAHRPLFYEPESALVMTRILILLDRMIGKVFAGGGAAVQLVAAAGGGGAAAWATAGASPVRGK